MKSNSSGEETLKALKMLLEYGEAAKGIVREFAPVRRIQARGPLKSSYYVALPQALGKLFLMRSDKVHVIIESLEEKDGKLEARLLLRQA